MSRPAFDRMRGYVEPDPPMTAPSPSRTVTADLRHLVDEQAEDEGLWFIARTAPEAYLQQELRRLHAAIEAALPVSPTDGLRRDQGLDWDAIEYLVDAAIRSETITANRGAEILGLSLRTWRERALEIREQGNPFVPVSPTDGLDAARETLQRMVREIGYAVDELAARLEVTRESE
jgi:hypothetical protein